VQLTLAKVSARVHEPACRLPASARNAPPRTTATRPAHRPEKSKTPAARAEGKRCVARQDTCSVSTPTMGLPTTQDAPAAAGTQPAAHDRAAPVNAASPAKPAVSSA